MCVVDDLDNSLVLQESGFVFRGEFNLPLRYGFSYRSPDLNVNLHVVEPDHSFIELNLTFRDYMRTHEGARMEYQRLKGELLNDPTSFERVDFGLPVYTLRKDKLIKRFLEQAGYQGVGLNFCAHFKEWEEYHRIRDQEIFQRAGVVYDPKHPSLSDPKHIHFVLYFGMRIIGAAHIEFLSTSACALRPFAIDAPYKGRGFGTKMWSMIEKWLKKQEQSVVHAHVHPDARKFYEKLGFVPMPFDDDVLTENALDMGKLI